jgi:hypothetical protein
MSTLQAFFDGSHQFVAYAGVVGLINFARTGWAGDIDLCQVATYHIQPHKQQTFFFQCWRNLADDPLIMLS